MKSLLNIDILPPGKGPELEINLTYIVTFACFMAQDSNVRQLFINVKYL